MVGAVLETPTLLILPVLGVQNISGPQALQPFHIILASLRVFRIGHFLGLLFIL
jgi:hypothetical protein